MEKVTDNFGSLICMADAATGQVEERYRDLTMCVAIQIGELLRGYGAEKLSALDPSVYERLLKDAEAIGNG